MSPTIKKIKNEASSNTEEFSMTMQLQDIDFSHSNKIAPGISQSARLFRFPILL